MKKLKFITLLFITILFLTACSKDIDENVTITGDYFPSALNNYWNYDVKSTDNSTKITNHLKILSPLIRELRQTLN